nr:uncharacterized protein LOC131799266 [Pocillopora verrucosa]
MKIYVTSESKLDRVLKTTKVAMADIGLDFNEKKCAIAHVKRGVLDSRPYSKHVGESQIIERLASMEWKEEHDLLLYREILVYQPYKFKERTVERGKIWEEISNHLNTCETAKFRVNKRSVREQFKLIKEKFKRKIREEENLLGIDVEPTSELKQALEEICSFEESFPVEEKESKQAKEEENKHKAQEIRKKAMESYGQTKSRIVGDEAPMEPKEKKRRGGNDSIDFLREKSQLELEIRKRELELKEKETAPLFEQQKMMQLMQQQQQNMVELLSKLVNK